jgi:iron complex outermembrane receptor protein
MTTSPRAQWIGLLLATAAICAPYPAFAQAAAADDSATLDEIIVTARKREERLIDVPIPISAFTGADIDRRAVTNLSDMQASVPGLRIVETGVGGQRIQLRGVSQYLGLPTVGLYIDEVSVNSQVSAGGLDVKLLDMDRIEVLRGPQPTLYGEGSMGGTIRYVTRAPDLTGFSGSVLGEVNTVADGGIGTRFDAILNAPIVTDKVGLRLAASREDNAGWIDALGREDLNEIESTTLRGKLLIKPTEDLSISLLVLNQQSDQGLMNFTSADRTSSTQLQTGAKNRYTLGNLVVSWDVGPVTLLSSTGAIDRYDSVTYDLTEAYAPFFPLFGLPLDTLVGTTATGDTQTFTQEFRLTSNGSGPLQYAIGAVYNDTKTDSINATYTTPASFLSGSQPSSAESEAWAVFGNVSYDVTDRLQVDVGGRYFKDKRTQVSSSGAVQSGSFDTFNPRLSLKYKTGDNGMVYADMAKGFRSGGFNNVQAPETPPTYDPEKLWSYEIGTKQQFFDRRLSIEAAVYYTKYNDLQAVFPVYDVNGVQVATATTNQGKASGPGFDLTAAWRVMPDLTLTGVVGYNHVRADNDSANRFEGDPLDLVPDLTIAVAADYTHRISDGLTLIAHGDYSWIDSSSIILRNYAPTEYSDKRGQLNVKLALSTGRYQAYIYANNLTDEMKIAQPAFGGFPEPIYMKPRTIGFGVKADF